MSAALAFSHGANDAQKSVGVIAALLLADGEIDSLSASPTWATVACAAALTLGTALGGWRIIRTVGRRIYRMQPIDGLATQTASSGVILGASLARSADLDDPGRRLLGGRRRRWAQAIAPRPLVVVRRMGLAWLVTMPITAALAVSRSKLWRSADMKRDRRWFLPETPDVLGLLRAQARGHDRGDGRLRTPGPPGTPPPPRRSATAEHRGDAAKRELLERAPRRLRHADSSRRTCSRFRGGSTGSSTTRAT